jgi:hypothetical protein
MSDPSRVAVAEWERVPRVKLTACLAEVLNASGGLVLD